MLGFSIYLGSRLTEQDYDFIKQMQKHGFEEIFTSLHIPEEDGQVILQQLKTLTSWCQELGIKTVADVSAQGLANLNIAIDNIEEMRALQLTGFRIDDGVDMQVIARLSQAFEVIALNASTITQTNLTDLHRYQADFDHLEAWHNYYPRPETGLDRNWLAQKNAWLQAQGLKTMAFIAGDGQKRGPLFTGLPTLEDDRNKLPLAAAIGLAKTHCDHIFVGDPDLSAFSRCSIADYVHEGTVTLRIDRPIKNLISQVWHDRADVARDVVRLAEGRPRQLFKTEPTNTTERKLGAITVDNDDYGRYHGELQIAKRNLPPDRRVNVLAYVVPEDQELLPFIGSNQKIKFEYMEK